MELPPMGMLNDDIHYRLYGKKQRLSVNLFYPPLEVSVREKCRNTGRLAIHAHGVDAPAPVIPNIRITR